MFEDLPEQRRLLDAIAAGEAQGYDYLYGGGRFGSYADHPRQRRSITSGPNAGGATTAAGRYQFLAPTWDEVSGELGLSDFSPKSQDTAAWHLANKTYNAKTGRDLLGDLRSGRTQDVASALRGVWPSIPGGIEPNSATSSFNSRLGFSGEPSESPMAFSEGQGAISKAMQPKAQPERAPSLSARFLANGPGVLFGGQGEPGYDWGNRISRAGIALQSITDPKYLAGLSALQKDDAVTPHFDDNTGNIWGVKNGKFSLLGRMPGWKSPEQRQGDKESITQFNTLYGDLQKSGASVEGRLDAIREARTFLSNPSVYQGTGGEYVAQGRKLLASLGYGDAGAVRDADVANALAAQLTLQMREYAGGMPGALSDKDLAFLKSSTIGLDKSREANIQILDAYERSLKRTQDLAGLAQGYAKKNGRLDLGFYDEVSSFDKKRVKQRERDRGLNQFYLQ